MNQRCAYCYARPVAEPSGGQREQLSRVAELPRRTSQRQRQGLSAIDNAPRPKSKKDKNRLRRCAGCKTTHYCDATCQRADWAYVHAIECKALATWTAQSKLVRAQALQGSLRPPPGHDVVSSIPDVRIRLLARLIWTNKLAHKDSGVVAFDELESHYEKKMTNKAAGADADADADDGEEGGQGTALLADAQKLSTFVGMGFGVVPATQALMAGLGLPSAQSVLEVLSRSQTNSFELTSGEQDKIGLTLSPLLAMVNHSCRPNAIVTFPCGPGKAGTKAMKLVAIRELRPDEEVTSAYLDIAAPYEVRDRKVRQDYWFTCACEVCEQYRGHADSFRVKGRAVAAAAQQDASNIDPRHVAMCKQCRTGVRVLPPPEQVGTVTLRCTHCGHEETIQAQSLLQSIRRWDFPQSQRHLLDEITLRPLADWRQVWVRDFKPRIEALVDILPPSATPLYGLLSDARHFLTCVLEHLSPPRHSESSGSLSDGAASITAVVARASVNDDDDEPSCRTREWWTVFETCLLLSRLDVLAVTGIAYDVGIEVDTPNPSPPPPLPPLYAEGHPGRSLSLAGFGRWLNSSLEDEQIDGDGDGDGDAASTRLLSANFFPPAFLLVQQSRRRREGRGPSAQRPGQQQQQQQQPNRSKNRVARAHLAQRVLRDAMASAALGAATATATTTTTTTTTRSTGHASAHTHKDAAAPDDDDDDDDDEEEMSGGLEREAQSQLMSVEEWLRDNDGSRAA
ncbi:unnamed protein product [Parajaminaea phylloscopi]